MNERTHGRDPAHGLPFNDAPRRESRDETMSASEPLRILLVEDVPSDAELIARELTRGGVVFAMTRVDSGESFLESLTSFSPDLILADYNLPGFGGRQALDICRRMTPEIPFIFVSGSIGEERAVESLKAGATDYVIKDRLQRLPSAVQRAIDESQQRREKMRADESLRSSEELFRIITRATNDGVWDWNLVTDTIWISETVLHMFGYAGMSQIIRPGWWQERIHPDDREQLLGAVSRSIESGLDQWSGEYRFRTASGAYAHLHDRAYVMRADDGTPRRMVGALQDVTDRKNTEEEIRRLNRLNELVLNAAGNSISAVNAQGIEIMANPMSASMTQYPLKESSGRFRHELVHHTRADGSPYRWEECPVYKTLEDGKVRQVLDEVFWRRDGTSFPVEYSVTPIVEDFQVIAAVEVAEDVTARKRIERQLEQASRLSGIGRLAATVAHEFNNVLMGIQPFAELIERRTAESDLAALSHRIVESVRRGKKITQEILRFTQPSQPDLQKLAVADWLHRFEDEGARIAGPSISIVIEAEENLHVMADPVHLHQVFSNLVFNACDAMPDGGTITIQAAKGSSDFFPFGLVSDPDRYIHFRVTDNGKGIPASALPYIFDPLFTTKKSGTGLGLAVTYQIIGQHGGHILVDSREGEGTTFHILLPEGEGIVKASEDRTASSRRPRNILLVEDDQSVAEGLTYLLELEGTTVHAVHRGDEVAEAVKRFQPELIILDIGLPDMSGYEVYERLILTHPDIPVIFSSGHGDEARLETFRKEHGVAFLLKPYDATALMRLIEELLEDRPSA